MIIQLIGYTANNQKIVWKYGIGNKKRINIILNPVQPIKVIIAGGVDIFIPLR